MIQSDANYERAKVEAATLRAFITGQWERVAAGGIGREEAERTTAPAEADLRRVVEQIEAWEARPESWPRAALGGAVKAAFLIVATALLAWEWVSRRPGSDARPPRGP